MKKFREVGVTRMFSIPDYAPYPLRALALAFLAFLSEMQTSSCMLRCVLLPVADRCYPRYKSGSVVSHKPHTGIPISSESLPSPCARVPPATGSVAECMQFCGKRSSFHLPVECCCFPYLISEQNGGGGLLCPIPTASRAVGVLWDRTWCLKQPKHPALPHGRFSSWKISVK